MSEKSNKESAPEGIGPFKRGKVFYKLLISYFSILLIPLFLSLVVFRQSHSLLRQEAERANELLLNQMKAYCDGTINDALSVMSLLSNNQRLEGLIYEKGPSDKDILYKAYSLSNDFIDYQFANRNIPSFYVYLPSLDLIISPFGFYSTLSYYKNILTGIDMSFEEWLSRFTDMNGRYFSAFQTVDQSGQLVPTLAVFSPLPVTDISGRANAFCIVEVELSLITDLMRDTIWTDKSILAISDRDRGILVSSKNDLSQEFLMEKINPLYLPSDYMDRIELDGMEYAVLITRSDVVPWHYISLIPVNIYNDRFNRLYQVNVLFIIIFALIGGGLVYVTTQKRYKPIQDIMKLMSPEGGDDVTLSNDEFNIITRSIQLTLDEDTRLKKEMKENLPIFRQRELRRLLKGEIQWNREEEERLGKLGLHFEKSLFLLVLLDIEPEEDTPVSLRSDCIEMLQKRDISSEYFYMIKDLDGYVAYLVNRSENRYLEILERMARLRSEIEEEHSVTVAMGLSRLHGRSEGFSILFREARRALEYRLVKGRSRPILFEDIQEASHSYYYPLDEEKKLIAAIRSGSDQDAFDILDRIISTNFDGEGFMAVEMARCLMSDLIATLIKSMDHFLSGKNNFWNDLRPVSRLTSCKSFEVLKTEMESILYQVCGYIKKGHKSHNEKLKEGIYSYVKEHFADPGLCADTIADRFERNSSYLARFFKEQTSLGLAAHIKQVRIERARELLMDDKRTVSSIAEEVGFSNANAFIRAFKEIEGLTPGQYREQGIL